MHNSYTDRLHALPFGGLKTGVKTLRRLLAKLGNPQDKLRVFHVAGTNGKGSVCQMISQVLWKEFGYKVGLTLSPHLYTLHERVQINGVYISNDDLEEYLRRIFSLIAEEQRTLSFFETMILVALLYFADQQVDYAVIEVGLGGKYDATNVFADPEATIITTISDDHRHLLGPSLTQIFWNKAGIMKPGVPCFTRLDTPLIERAARLKKSPLYRVAQLQETNLLGDYQRENAGLVYVCLVTLGFDAVRVAKGLLQIAHPGRIQRLNDHILIDGAHNEEGVRAFHDYIETIRSRYSSVVTVFGTTKTREEYPRFFDQLIVGDINYLVIPLIEKRAVSPDNYKSHLGFETIDMHTLDNVWSKIPHDDPNVLIIIYGSLYLVGEVLEKSQVSKMN